MERSGFDVEKRISMYLNHEGFMQMAIAEAARAGAEGNSAVGSVIVQNNTVVASTQSTVKSEG